MTTLHTALDAPSLVFFAPAGTCSLNQSYSYAFGPRIKYGAGSGTHWRKKSCVFIAPIPLLTTAGAGSGRNPTGGCRRANRLS